MGPHSAGDANSLNSWDDLALLIIRASIALNLGAMRVTSPGYKPPGVVSIYGADSARQ